MRANLSRGHSLRMLLGCVLAASLLMALTPGVQATVVIGSNSCQGTSACDGATGPIGDNSCNGESACANTIGAIGDGSCNDDFACTLTTASIGNYSCNSTNVCGDLSNPVGDCQNNDYPPLECVQPDAQIRRSGGPLRGDDVYNLDAAGQTIDGGPRAYRQGAVRWFYVYIENDGMIPDQFTVMGCHQDETIQGIDDDPGYTVTFFRPSGANITAAVEAGTFHTPVLDPGERWAIRARVQIGPGAAHGSELYRLFTVTSMGNGAKQDSAKFEVARR